MAVGHYLRSKRIFFWKNPTGGYFDTARKAFRKQVSPYAINGAPDYIAVIYGVFIGFEVKSPTGRQSDSQKAFEDALRTAGGMYFIIKSLEDLIIALQQIEVALEIKI